MTRLSDGRILHRLRRRQIKRRSVVLEVPFVRAIAERLLGAQPAAADADTLPAAEAIRLALSINQLKIVALYAERAIGKYCKFGSHVVCQLKK